MQTVKNENAGFLFRVLLGTIMSLLHCDPKPGLIPLTGREIKKGPSPDILSPEVNNIMPTAQQMRCSTALQAGMLHYNCLSILNIKKYRNAKGN